MFYIFIKILNFIKSSIGNHSIFSKDIRFYLMLKESDFKTISEFPASEYGKLAIVANNKGEKYRKKMIELKFGKEKYKLEFQRAINTLIRMNHPTINRISFYSLPDCNNIQKEIYPISIFSDYEVNGSLADLMQLISNGENIEKWDSTHKMITIFGIAAALMYIHGCRIIYRNLKSTNVLFNSEYEPKLADFNFSRPPHFNMDSLTLDSTLITIPYDEDTEKTPLHAAPEILDNLPFNNKVDVYSYGVLLYELFVNKEPDFGMDDQEAIRSSITIGHRPPIPADLVPPSYQKLISECWDNKSSNRPSFKSIVRRLAQPEYILPDVDFDKYIEYTKKTLDDRFLLKDTDMKTQGPRADEIQKKADSGDVESQYKYGLILETGDGAIRNTREAMKYYKMACFNKKGHHLPSMHALARLYESQQKWEEAEVLFRTAADEGYKESQFHYAVMLKNGSGAVEKDIFKAAKFFKLAADQGEIDAQNFYANILLTGEGVMMNKKLAAEYFKKAADQGDGDSQNSYAMLLKNGCDGEITKNRSLAKEYLRKSAESGDINGMLNYADFLTEEVDPNDQSKKNQMKMKHAAYYYLKSSRLGNQTAKEKYDQIGIEISQEDEEFYANLHGSDEYPNEDEDNANNNDEKQLLEAAEKGDADSQYKYSMILLNKQKRSQAALTYLEKAADQNHVQAMLQLGYMLRDSIGIERDPKRARKLFQRASEQGSADAMAAYGFMRYKGLGFSNPNKEEGKEYLQKAAELQSSDGIAFLGKVLEEDDPRRSEELLKESCKLGNSNGEYYLAILNRKKNEENDRNALEVESLLRSSASKGNVEAQYEVALIDNDLEMLKVSADRGVEGASFSYANKIKEFDFDQSLFYYTKAAEQENSPAAMVEAAKCLWTSKPHKSSTFLKNAIKYKFPQAYTLYGRYLIEQKEKKDKNSLIMSHLSNFDENDIDLDTFDVDLNDDQESKQKVEEEAAHYYHLGASLNDPKGMLYYGLAFRDGVGVSKNYSKAHKYLKKSADNGDVEGMVQLALFTDDEQESLEYFTRAAKFNADRWSDEARYYLAMIYKDQGRYTESFQLLEKAAKNGHEDAMFQVAVFYQNGIGVPQNDAQAMNYYALSANSPNPKAAAQFNFALMLKKQSDQQKQQVEAPIELKDIFRRRSKISHFNSTPLCDTIKLYDSIESFESVGVVFDTDTNCENDSNRRIVKNNLTRAAKYFRAAALQGDAEAMNNYGLMLMKGEGVPQNLKEAQKYFQMSSDRGNSFGQNNLGILVKNVEPNKATHLFKLSAQQNNLSGMNNYGLMLMSKNYSENDRIEALSMFKAAADQGHPNAMFNYASLIIKEIKKGFVIYDDDGSLISIENVMEKYMKKSAELGDIDAMNSYGSFLFKNKKDSKTAQIYFREAVEAGSSTGMNKLATLIKFQLDDAENDAIDDFEEKKNEMMDLYQRAAELENTVAMNNLALLYYNGLYVKKDVQKAKEIYKKAMNLGDAKASKIYKSICSPRKKK